MYHMKSIVNHGEMISLPNCMYFVNNFDDSYKEIEAINVRNQVKKFLKVPSNKMTELEQRQEQLLKKLDILYDRIKVISSYCNTEDGAKTKSVPKKVSSLDEMVLVANPDNLPYYLLKVLKDSFEAINLSCHIHSSVSNENKTKINSFIKDLKSADSKTKINLRLIFKSVSPDTELKLSSFSTPIVGTVNILRYFSYAYPNAIPYDDTDYKIDGLLDICFMLENAPQNKDEFFKKLFTDQNGWLYKNNYSIVDLAVFNIAKQSKSNTKYIPKVWLEMCEKL